MTREHFEANVARIIDYIYAGDAFQVVPSPALVGGGPGAAPSASTGACAP